MAEAKENPAPRGGKKGLVWLVILIGVVAVSAGGGFGVGTILRGGPDAAQADSLPAEPTAGGSTDPAGGISHEELTYYEFEPITANADERGLTRYIRATIILAIKSEVEKKVSATALLEKKKPELKNWLTIFLASRTLEEVRGAQNLNRLRREIRDSFNEQLWPDRAPVVENVLFKDFAVQ